MLLQRTKDGGPPRPRFIEHRTDGTKHVYTTAQPQPQYAPRSQYAAMLAAQRQRSMQNAFPQIPGTAARVSAQPFLQGMSASMASPPSYLGAAEHVTRQYAQQLDPYQREQLNQVRSLFAARPLGSQPQTLFAAQPVEQQPQLFGYSHMYPQHMYSAAASAPNSFANPVRATPTSYLSQHPGGQTAPVDLYQPIRHPPAPTIQRPSSGQSEDPPLRWDYMG